MSFPLSLLFFIEKEKKKRKKRHRGHNRTCENTKRKKGKEEKEEGKTKIKRVIDFCEKEINKIMKIINNKCVYTYL